jgi:hypothetical protein
MVTVHEADKAERNGPGRAGGSEAFWLELARLGPIGSLPKLGVASSNLVSRSGKEEEGAGE